MSQLAFDIDAMIHTLDVEQMPAWTGAPLHFTTAYYAPSDLDAAFRRYQMEHGRFGCVPLSHMWNRSGMTGVHAVANGHTLVSFTADVRHSYLCSGHKWNAAQPCSCVGELMHQGICEECRWNAISDSENDIVEAWHDHAMPGWRELPVLPEDLRLTTQGETSQRGQAWLDGYPAVWKFEGAPIRTKRESPATRHVAGRSPWGGFDLSA